MKNALAAAVACVAGFAALRYAILSVARWPALEAHEAAMLAEKLERSRQRTAFMAGFWQTLGVAAWVVVVALAVACAVAVVAFAARQRNLARVVPVGKDGLPAPMQYRLPGGTIAVLPASMLTGPVMIGPRGIQVLDNPHGAQLHLQNTRVQAAAALDLPAIGRMPNGATWRALSGGYDPKPLPAAPALLPAPAAPVNVVSALNASAPDAWNLGSDAQGRFCALPLSEYNNAFIGGAQGTGKTTLAITLLMYAARFGLHPIVLDPKGGVDFGVLDPWIERHDCDAESVLDQLHALAREEGRRAALQARHNVKHWRDFNGQEGPALFVLVEELGRLRDDLSMLPGGRAQQEKFDRVLIGLLRTCRSRGIHVAALNQTVSLPGEIMTQLKFRVAFWMDLTDAMRLGMHEATTLAPVGEFVHNHRRYSSFYVADPVRHMQGHIPPLRTPRLIESTARPVSTAFQPLSIERPVESRLKPVETPATSGVETVETVEGGGGVWGAETPLPPFTESHFNRLNSVPRERVKTEAAKLACTALLAAGAPITINNILAWALQGGVDLSVGTASTARAEWKAEKGIA